MGVCDPTYTQRLLESLLSITVFLGVSMPTSYIFLTLYKDIQGSTGERIGTTLGATLFFLIIVWVPCYFFLKSLIAGYHF